MVAPLTLDQLPPEFLAAAVREGESDADAVGLFLHTLGFHGTPDHPAVLPAGFLLDLAAALRFLKWELRGIRVHLDAGMPSAIEAIEQTFLRHGEEPVREKPPAFFPTVSALAPRFSWEAPDLLSAVVELDDIDEDVLVEAFAQFLWSRRKRKKLSPLAEE